MKTKQIILYYWILTVLMTVIMLMAAVPDLLILPEAATFLMRLGYPKYLLPFLGLAKTLAVAVILLPGLPRLKEWAYAGLVFDLVGAFYSHTCVGDTLKVSGFSLIALFLVASSYVFHRKTQARREPHESYA